MNIHLSLKFKFRFTNEQLSVLPRGTELAAATLIWIPDLLLCVISSPGLCEVLA